MTNYEPEYGDLEDYDEEEDMEFDDCPYGSGAMPQLGVDDCEFTCPLSASCQAIFEDRKDCVRNKSNDAPEDCIFFHYGKCYIDLSNFAPSRLRALLIRLQCRLGRYPRHEEGKR